jgi:hypothetical protein
VTRRVFAVVEELAAFTIWHEMMIDNLKPFFEAGAMLTPFPALSGHVQRCAYFAQPAVRRVMVHAYMPILLHGKRGHTDGAFQYLEPRIHGNGFADLTGNSGNQVSIRNNGCKAEKSRDLQQHVTLNTLGLECVFQQGMTFS